LIRQIAVDEARKAMRGLDHKIEIAQSISTDNTLETLQKRRVMSIAGKIAAGNARKSMQGWITKYE
jgi:hypothetical protein